MSEKKSHRAEPVRPPEDPHKAGLDRAKSEVKATVDFFGRWLMGEDVLAGTPLAAIRDQAMAKLREVGDDVERAIETRERSEELRARTLPHGAAAPAPPAEVARSSPGGDRGPCMDLVDCLPCRGMGAVMDRERQIPEVCQTCHGLCKVTACQTCRGQGAVIKAIAEPPYRTATRCPACKGSGRSR